LKKSICVLILVLLSQGFLCSAQDTIYSSGKIYYESLNDKLTIYLYGITKLNQFQLKNAEKEDLIKYKPNERLNLGVGFNYRWLGIGAGWESAQHLILNL
jgi:hypothetical protein